jgi:glycosyltransferase involved in cell wall biosynthesis
LTVIPLGFSGLSALARPVQSGGSPDARTWVHAAMSAAHGRLFPAASQARQWLAPIELVRHIARVRAIVSSTHPDVVHAMRIPFEGMLAVLAVREVPVVVSVWGNDFTLHAAGSRLVAAFTKYTLRRADALHCDCHRDLRLALAMGFDAQKPAVVLPGAGGIDQVTFHPRTRDAEPPPLLDGVSHRPIVVNPRGFRGYVRNEEFFQSIPRVLQHVPDALFVCSAMAHNKWAQRRVADLGIEGSVRLLPYVPHSQMAAILARAEVAVSPSEHDGTPNTLLESMACGAFPVAGDIESVREWITDGHNGLLCNPADPAALAAAITRALTDAPLRDRARQYNGELVASRAEHGAVMRAATTFYQRVVGPIRFSEDSSKCAG